MKLENYMQDGAWYQARAVLAHLQGVNNIADEAEVARWENCREQGYIVSLYNNDIKKQLNIIFYEHRNSDSVTALKWEQHEINSINIDTIKEGVFESKWDSDFSVWYWEYMKMGNWIAKELAEFSKLI